MHHFERNYRGLEACHKIIRGDAKDLSAGEVDKKIANLTNEWPSVCLDFEVTEGFFGKIALIDIYGAMRNRARWRASKEKAVDNWREYSACFAKLDDFARKHGASDRTRIEIPTQSGTDFFQPAA